MRYKLFASVAEYLMLGCAGPALDWCAAVVAARQSGNMLQTVMSAVAEDVISGCEMGAN